FIFLSEESLETVLRRGPWAFADLIESIARSLGERMEVEFDETCLQFIRVRINWDVDNPLRFQRNYQFTPGVNTVLRFFYERLRGFCEVCGLMTHDSGSCMIQNGGMEGSEEDNDDDENQEMVGNPRVEIHEIDDVGQPIFLEFGESDHRPLVTRISETEETKRGFFIYDSRMTHKDGFNDSMLKGWNEQAGNLQHVSLTQRIFLCQKQIAIWKRKYRINATENIAIARHALDKAMANGGITTAERAKLRKNLNEAYI
ncbi:unnamed protein product, partial [Arabidopsis halleri]